jgi:hypothetical protein
MAYTLLHAHGERGWTIGLRDRDEKTITAKDWALYRMQIRDRNGEPICYDILHHSGLLSQQYWLDQWMKVELERLNYIRYHQRQLRAEVYQGLADAVAAGDTSEAGTFVVLPSTFLGSPRNYCTNYADAMAIVAKYGKPDYFSLSLLLRTQNGPKFLGLVHLTVSAAYALTSLQEYSKLNLTLSSMIC